MHKSERKVFLSWYETFAKKEVFDKRRVLESNCQADMTVLREACRTFRKHFLQIGNVEAFLEIMTIASACNKVFRKKFFQPDRIGLIPVRATLTLEDRVARREERGQEDTAWEEW
jgi:hypothetical protein